MAINLNTASTIPTTAKNVTGGNVPKPTKPGIVRALMRKSNQCYIDCLPQVSQTPIDTLNALALLGLRAFGG